MRNKGIFTNEEYSVVINKNSKILSFNKINNCTVYDGTISASEVSNSVIASGAVVKHSFLNGAIVRRNATVGVYSHLREGSVIGENVRIGNFVEKTSTIYCFFCDLYVFFSQVRHCFKFSLAFFGKM